MHAHTFATQTRTLAPSQILRGVAGPRAVATGLATPSFVISSCICPVSRRSDSRYPWPGAAMADLEVDFGSLVEGGPV
jgi:hypothetical protein